MTTCKATRRAIILSVILAGVGATFAARAAKAEELHGTATAAGDKRYSVEIKPLPFLATLLPGGAGFGGEFEVKMTHNLSIFADVSHVHVHLTDEMIRNMQENQSHTDGIQDDLVANGIGAGVRYYGNAFDDSWYVGGNIGSATSKGSWVYGNERLEDDSSSYTSGVGVGYRWLWDSGFLIRLGGGLNATTITSREVTALTSNNPTQLAAAQDNVEGKVPRNRTVIMPTLDFGLGWTF